MIEHLASGKIDAAIVDLSRLQEKLRNWLLFREYYVRLIVKGHPAATVGCHRWPAWPHRTSCVVADLRASAPRGNPSCAGRVHRKIALRIPHFTILPGLIAQSDLVAVLPSRVARVFQPNGDLQSLPLPRTNAGFRSTRSDPRVPCRSIGGAMAGRASSACSVRSLMRSRPGCMPAQLSEACRQYRITVCSSYEAMNERHGSSSQGHVFVSRQAMFAEHRCTAVPW